MAKNCSYKFKDKKTNKEYKTKREENRLKP